MQSQKKHFLLKKHKKNTKTKILKEKNQTGAQQTLPGCVILLYHIYKEGLQTKDSPIVQNCFTLKHSTAKSTATLSKWKLADD